MVFKILTHAEYEFMSPEDEFTSFKNITINFRMTDTARPSYITS